MGNETCPVKRITKRKKSSAVHSSEGEREREREKRKKKREEKMFLAHREEKQGRTRQSVVIFRQQLANIRALLILSRFFSLS